MLEPLPPPPGPSECDRALRSSAARRSGGASSTSLFHSRDDWIAGYQLLDRPIAIEIRPPETSAPWFL